MMPVNSQAVGGLLTTPNGTVLVALPADRDGQLALLDQLDDSCVILVGTAGASLAYRSLNGLARLTLGHRVRIHPCDAPPTVLAITAAVMAAGNFGPGDVLEILSSLRAVTTTVAITDSVTRLTAPAPSVSSHLRSMLPGGQFVVDLPGNRVLRGEHSLTRLKRMHGAALAIAGAGDELSVSWQERLAELAPLAPRLQLGPVESDAVPWRAERWAEVTGLAVSIDDLTSRLRMYLVQQKCVSCQAPISGRICPMCGIICGTAISGSSKQVDGEKKQLRTRSGRRKSPLTEPVASPAPAPAELTEPDLGAATVPVQPSISGGTH
jgi:hypothetical protein